MLFSLTLHQHKTCEPSPTNSLISCYYLCICTIICIIYQYTRAWYATCTYFQNNESSASPRSQDSYSAPKSKGSSGPPCGSVLGFVYNKSCGLKAQVFFLEVPCLWHGSICWFMVLLFLCQECKMRLVSWGIVARVFDLGVSISVTVQVPFLYMRKK